MDYIKRQIRLYKSLEANGLNAFIVQKKQNINYLSGVKGDDALLILSYKGNTLITDSRYKEEYRLFSKNCSVKIAKANIFSEAAFICNKKGFKKIGFESPFFSYYNYMVLRGKIGRASLKPCAGIVEGLRITKDHDEITLIRDSSVKCLRVMDAAIKILRPSMTEMSLKNSIEAYILKNSLQKADFLIAASGNNASMPHASASNKKINKNEMCIIDLGLMVDGYNSDLTRTVYLGKIDRKYLKLYNIVLTAQLKAIEKIRPGVKCSYIDKISRDYIYHKGFGKYFIHSLGHGLGLETHESPNISPKSSAILEKHMVFTVEPGIYIPGWGGIRIEDDIIVTGTGYEILTKGASGILWK